MTDVHDMLSQDAFFMVNKKITQKFGIETALLLSFMISWERFYSESGRTVDGYFFKSAEMIKEDTTLSPHKQRKAFEQLEKAGILIIELKGVPATNHFMIDHSQLLKFFTTGCQKTSQQDVKNFNTTKKQELKNKEKNNSTPREIALSFFENEDQQMKVALYASKQSGETMEFCLTEVKKFVSYWTELTHSGRKQKWQSQKCFELPRRLQTWFSNSKKFSRGISFASANKNADLEEYNNSKL